MRMLTVVLIVAIFLVWFAVVSMVLVGYLRPEDQCERIGSERFRDFFHVSLCMCLHVHAHVCESAHVHTDTCTCVRVCTCAYRYMHMCVFSLRCVCCTYSNLRTPVTNSHLCTHLLCILILHSEVWNSRFNFHFLFLFQSFESMFQLLMQEGWSQLYSEFQCRRDGLWLLINFYFIVLHLIASLFLLNFFVAIILDNLDYDEDVKIQKLEEAEKSKEKIQKVPRHLRIFKVGGPKKIPVPKLSSADTPNLTEADVRNFYNVGEVTDLPSDYFNEHPPLPYDTSSRRSSELSNLDLLTGEKVSTGSGISAHQGKYWGIQGILSQVRAFRQHTRENEGSRPGQSSRSAATGDFLGNKLQVDSDR